MLNHNPCKRLGRFDGRKPGNRKARLAKRPLHRELVASESRDAFGRTGQSEPARDRRTVIGAFVAMDIAPSMRRILRLNRSAAADVSSAPSASAMRIESVMAKAELGIAIGDDHVKAEFLRASGRVGGLSAPEIMRSAFCPACDPWCCVTESCALNAAMHRNCPARACRALSPCPLIFCYMERRQGANARFAQVPKKHVVPAGAMTQGQRPAVALDFSRESGDQARMTNPASETIPATETCLLFGQSMSRRPTAKS